MDAVHRIWVSKMKRSVTVEDLSATFYRFGNFAEGIRLRFDVKGAEAVIT